MSNTQHFKAKVISPAEVVQPQVEDVLEEVNVTEPTVIEESTNPVVQNDVAPVVTEVTPASVPPVTKKEEVVVQKPTVVSTKASISIVEPEVAQKDPEKSLGYKILSERIDAFIKYKKEAPIVKPTECIQLFQNIIVYALENSNNLEVLNKLYAFFKSNRKDILQPSVALQGIENKESYTRNNMSMAYMLLYTVTDPNPGPIDFEKASSNLSPSFVAFIQNKMKK